MAREQQTDSNSYLIKQRFAINTKYIAVFDTRRGDYIVLLGAGDDDDDDKNECQLTSPN